MSFRTSQTNVVGLCADDGVVWSFQSNNEPVRSDASAKILILAMRGSVDDTLLVALAPNPVERATETSELMTVDVAVMM